MRKRIIDEVQAEIFQPKSRFRRYVAHPFGLPLMLFVSLVLITAVALASFAVWQSRGNRAFVFDANFIVIVQHDGQAQTVPTDAKVVGALLERLNITVHPGDRVEPALDAPITNDNFRINIYRSAPVAVIDGSNFTLVNSAAATPRAVVAQSSDALYAEDRVTTELTSNFLLQHSLGYRAIVERATPIALQLYGKPLTVRTHAATVKDLLAEKNIKLTTDDTVRPGLETPLSANLQVAVIRNGIQVVTLDEEVPPPVQNVIDSSLSFGSQAVRQEGVPGKVTNTYEIKIENGNEVSRVLLQSVKVSDPVPRIVAKGNTVNIPADKQSVMAAAGISPNDYGYVDYIFSRESRWNAAAVNPGGCTGLGQACPGSKLAAVCPEWQNDPVCQTRFFSGYAARYGGWEGAYNAWISKHWW